MKSAMKKTASLLLCAALTAAVFLMPAAAVGAEPAGYEEQLLPIMGWSSWNHFGSEGINEDVCLRQMELLEEYGLARLGYTYLNIDDGCYYVFDLALEPGSTELRLVCEPGVSIDHRNDYMHAEWADAAFELEHPVSLWKVDEFFRNDWDWLKSFLEKIRDFLFHPFTP